MQERNPLASLASAGLAVLALMLTACQPQPPYAPAAAPAAPSPEPQAEPPAGTLLQGLAEALIDTGFYEQVAVTGTIGQHYRPGEDRWTVLACFDFVAPDGEQGTNCIDSIDAFQLTNGTWIVGVTINEVYRWRAIGLPSAAMPAPGPAPGATPAAPPGAAD